MKIVRQTQQELVAEDGTAWISMLCALGSLANLYASIAARQPKLLVVAGLFALFALVSLSRMTFVFDRMQRRVRYKGRKLFKTESGTIPFDEIADIGTEAIGGADGPSYRLAILTPQGSVPMAYSYGGNSQRYESLRKTILAFVKPEAAASGSSAAGNDPSIRSLLAQGRKIDAITLVRTRESLGLTQAVERVNEVEKRMKAGS
jgi:hypothetical protein